eukprot:1553993-Prorocentrum_lima.AAC.1
MDVCVGYAVMVVLSGLLTKLLPTGGCYRRHSPVVVACVERRRCPQALPTGCSFPSYDRRRCPPAVVNEGIAH